jgi:Pentapeptide repeats (9 copies)
MNPFQHRWLIQNSMRHRGAECFSTGPYSGMLSLIIPCVGTYILFKGVKFLGVRYDVADFSNSVLQGALFDKDDEKPAKLTQATFDDADLSSAHFEHAEITTAKFRHANLRGARFINAAINGADFTRADLTDADFQGATILDANFDGAILRKTTFKDAKIDEQSLDSAAICKVIRAAGDRIEGDCGNLPSFMMSVPAPLAQNCNPNAAIAPRKLNQRRAPRLELKAPSIVEGDIHHEQMMKASTEAQIDLDQQARSGNRVSMVEGTIDPFRKPSDANYDPTDLTLRERATDGQSCRTTRLGECGLQRPPN